MIPSSAIIPVVLFAYARPAHLTRVLACLRENRVPLILAFADGAKKGAGNTAVVAEVRSILRSIDWAEVRVVEREENLGLGRNVLAGVTEVAACHDMFVVWEDDLICVPGTYDWLCAALRQYAGDLRVMSVTGWTHPRVTPHKVERMPYFDARGESWSWGTWSRSWRGMVEETALEKMTAVQRRGIDPATCGDDLPAQAEQESKRNLWAARWLYHHILHDGLCLRPPWSMVDHKGFDTFASNAPLAEGWDQPTLADAPLIPKVWPIPREENDGRRLWKSAQHIGWRRRLRLFLHRWFSF